MTDAKSESVLSHNSNSQLKQELRNKKFSTELWDGFEKVFERITRGRHDLKKLKQYLEERAEIEKAYGISLEKLGKIQEFQEECTISKTFVDAKDGAISLSKQHNQFSTVCIEIAALLEKMINEIKNIKTKLNLNYKKLTQEEKARTLAHTKARQQYADAIKAAEAATIANRQAAPPKQKEKLEKTLKASLKTVETTNQLYKKSVDSLRSIQEQLHKETAVMLESFEDLETRRLTLMQEQMERFAQQHDFIKSSIDQIALFLHKGVDAVHIKKDVQDFIAKTSTGKEVPHYVEYVAIASPTLGIEAESYHPQHHDNKSDHSFPNVSASGDPASEQKVFTEPTAQALYDFDSTEPDELPFKAGDYIKVYTAPSDNDWWQGEINGRVGIFPKDYVQHLNPHLSQSPSPPPQPAPPPQPPASSSSSAQSQSKQQSSMPKTNAFNPQPPSQPKTTGAVNNNSKAQQQQQQQQQQHQGEPGAPGEALKLIDATCEALYDFEAQGADELSFKQGETLIITGELNGWYLGKTKDGARVGIFPSNYVTIKS